jgi:hypothetical protein
MGLLVRTTPGPDGSGGRLRELLPSWAQRVRSVVVASASDGVPHPPEQHQDQADHEDNDAERPEDGDFEQEPGDE